MKTVGDLYLSGEVPDFDSKYDKTGGTISGDVKISGDVEIYNGNYI